MEIITTIAIEKLNRVVEILIKEAAPEKIIIFGSHARNEANPQSDIDFLVVTQNSSENRFQMAIRLRRCLSPLRIPVDIIVHDCKTVMEWENVPGNLLYTITHEGKVIYERD
jgi:predicted nucleotidyltransferase